MAEKESNSEHQSQTTEPYTPKNPDPQHNSSPLSNISQPSKAKSKTGNNIQLYIVLVSSVTFWAGAMAFYDFP
jgi:hypothetical protein